MDSADLSTVTTFSFIVLVLEREAGRRPRIQDLVTIRKTFISAQEEMNAKFRSQKGPERVSGLYCS